LGSSKLIQESEFKKLLRSLPFQLEDSKWKLLYCSAIHGVSMNTFYMKIQNSPQSFILIQDDNNHVFGGYNPESWRIDTKFYGTGESFVFSIRPEFIIYPWTKANDLFVYSTLDIIGMGGGQSGNFAFYLENQFSRGISKTSNTYLNRQLSATENFNCTMIEIWGREIEIL